MPYSIHSMSNEYQDCTQSITDRNQAVKELEKASGSLLQQSKNISGKSSNVLIKVARKNFEVSRDMMQEKILELKQKKYNPFAKAAVFLANHKIYVGDLYTMHAVHKKFDKIIGLARKDIMTELKKDGFYREISSKRGQEKIADELKQLGNDLLPNDAIVVLMPQRNFNQYLTYLCASKSPSGQLTLKEGHVRYLGQNSEDKPKFWVRPKGLDDTEIVGIDELKQHIAFGAIGPIGNATALTMEGMPVYKAAQILANAQKQPPPEQ